MAIFVVNYNSVSTMGQRVFNFLDTFVDVVDQDVDVWLVDNGSTDGSYSVLSQRYGGMLKFLALPKNLGYGAACSLAYRYTRLMGLEYDYYVCSNNDIELFPQKIGELLSYLRALEKAYPKGFIAAPLLLNGNDGLIDYGGYFIDDSGGTWGLRLAALTPREIRRLTPISYADGAFQIVHRNVVETIGWFDPKYFLYYEDVEFSLRAWRARFPSLLIPLVIGRHYRSASTGRSVYKVTFLSYRNRLLIIREYLGALPLLKFLLWIVSYPLRVFDQKISALDRYIEITAPGVPTPRWGIREYLEVLRHLVRALYEGFTASVGSRRAGGVPVVKTSWMKYLSMKSLLNDVRSEITRVTKDVEG
ncbi:glycosyltransferase family 2 protein [Pyrobaculum neutrophilum]|nr:glycosyltransferase family 2 protein [Pyrobaculum neutrophilum]